MTARRGVRCLGGLAIAGLLLALVGGPAQAVAPPSPWDGHNPFKCRIQNAGRGTKVPDPGADPYCVRFDKTNQNVTQLGLVKFLSLEPARTAAAGPKCFYFQEDHWRGSVIQSDGQTKIYEFYGHYFFNKATGDGGAWVTDFNINGRTFDPAGLPGFPSQYGRYFGPGTGGFISHNAVPVDPSCAAKARTHPKAIYRSATSAPRCVSVQGHVSRRGIGPVMLGLREHRIRGLLGPPGAVRRGFLRYCADRGGYLLIGEPGDRSGTFGSGGAARAVMLLTTSRQFWLRGRRGSKVRVGSRTSALPGRGWRWRAVSRTGRRDWIRHENLLAEISAGRVRCLGVYARQAIRRSGALGGYLRHAM